MRPTGIRASTAREVDETNRRFYDALWADARLVEPDRFNTWPLVCDLVSSSRPRLEVGPGLRPRLPIEGTHFVDLSAPAVAKLRRRGASAVRARITSIPFPDGAFDLVCALDIVEHIVDDEAALSELARVASPGAVLLLSVPLHASSWSTFDELVGHHRRYEPEALVAQLATHGFFAERSAVFGMQPRSSRIRDLGMWFLSNRRERAMWMYNRVFMLMGLRSQKPLSLTQGMVDAEGLDEILIVCRKHGVASRSQPTASPASAGEMFLSINGGSENDEGSDDERGLDRASGDDGMHDRRCARDGCAGESGDMGRLRARGRPVIQGRKSLYGYGVGSGRPG